MMMDVCSWNVIKMCGIFAGCFADAAQQRGQQRAGTCICSGSAHATAEAQLCPSSNTVLDVVGRRACVRACVRVRVCLGVGEGVGADAGVRLRLRMGVGVGVRVRVVGRACACA